MSLGNKIYELRKQNKMTQKDLATLLNVSNKIVSRWETDVTLPDIKMLNKIASIFNISVNEFYSSSTSNPQKEEYDKERDFRFKRTTLIAILILSLNIIVHIYQIVFIKGINGVFNTRGQFIILLCGFISIFLILLSLTIYLIALVKLKEFSQYKKLKETYSKTIKKGNIIYFSILTSLILIFIILDLILFI